MVLYELRGDIYVRATVADNEPRCCLLRPVAAVVVVVVVVVAAVACWPFCILYSTD